MTAKEIAIGVDGYVAEVLNEYKKYMETEGAKYADMYTRGEDTIQLQLHARGLQYMI